MKISPLAGKPAEASMLVNVPRLVSAYYTEVPDPSVPEQRVAFGTSGHRGFSFDDAFNEWHILAISPAICVDVWINTSRRPWEVCGTSGMKVLVNGGINLSELDGWWQKSTRLKSDGR